MFFGVCRKGLLVFALLQLLIIICSNNSRLGLESVEASGGRDDGGDCGRISTVTVVVLSSTSVAA